MGNCILTEKEESEHKEFNKSIRHDTFMAKANMNPHELNTDLLFKVIDKLFIYAANNYPHTCADYRDDEFRKLATEYDVNEVRKATNDGEGLSWLPDAYERLMKENETMRILKSEPIPNGKVVIKTETIPGEVTSSKKEAIWDEQIYSYQNPLSYEDTLAFADTTLNLDNLVDECLESNNYTVPNHVKEIWLLFLRLNVTVNMNK